MAWLSGKKLETIEDVTAYQMCTGCGACAYFRPDALEMVDSLNHGRRPIRRRRASQEALRQATDVCPGVHLAGEDQPSADEGLIGELRAAWGPIFAVWEGYATDPGIRFAGSSGGIATALALFCIERRGMCGALHIRSRPDVPYLNHTVLSHTRDQLLAATGSRYAPASPCDRLDLVEVAAAPCVLIGKPCDIAASWKARKRRAGLDRNLGLTIAMFCAGTPSTRGTLEMLQAMGVEDVRDVLDVRYRGNGWPGRATIQVRTEAGVEERFLSYEQSWGAILQSHRQWRCYVCADHTGEFADVALGDPWYQPPAGTNDPGRSLVLARSALGLRLIRAAIEEGYLDLHPADPQIVRQSQPNLLRARGAVWGRILTSRLMGAAAPVYKGMPTFRFWLRALTARQKLRSTLGTARRIRRRGLRRPAAMEPYLPEPKPPNQAR